LRAISMGLRKPLWTMSSFLILETAT